MGNPFIILTVILLALLAFSLFFAALIAAKHASEKEYRCVRCKKLFYPRLRDSFGAAYSFGHKSVLVKCPHCKNRARLLPTDETAHHGKCTD
jgi:DNA-directed RNA polymerase subunit RPC12/RpoP